MVCSHHLLGAYGWKQYIKVDSGRRKSSVLRFVPWRDVSKYLILHMRSMILVLCAGGC
jgi:hypothetical protein